ncbi:MAG TPA: DUF4178 domain-containing protein [Oligoflexus sp.]|uniref:DUF4178 domain-containing protein n=1 Tax=Oligoflexus sp. TaxID=1971216 RepID=UPI002D7FC84E|nr:DUF4178 domain-containing protein [Oligoflexus sp.]HET9241473.1 DUF4178 domain-containing protein [Oligoflexus sp.]
MAGEISFNCLQCGSPIAIHAPGQSLSYACRACGALVEENHQGLRILKKASQSMLWKPLLELGSKNKLRGETWQVIGFMVRSDGSGDYVWSEYLLFNPFQGFRWLTESQGHWNFLHMTRHRPKSALGTWVSWGGRRYRLFLKGKARVKFVLGEFYWRVKIGDEVTVKDYIAPPDILSSEEDGTEEMWSAGTYVEPEDIEKAFRPLHPMPARVGVAPNQPSRYLEKRNAYLKHWGFFAAILIALHLLMNSFKQETTVLDTNILRDGKVPVQLLRSESFTLDKSGTNVKIQVYAPLQNSWLNLRFTMVQEDGQAAAPIEFGRDLYRYESGSEGSESHTLDEVFLKHLDQGRYRLDINSEMGWVDPSILSKQDFPLRVTVKKDVKVISPLVLCLILVSLFPLWILLGDWRFESKRWADSDVNG